MKIYKSSRSKRLNAVFILTIILLIAVTITALFREINNGFYVAIVINFLTLLLLIHIALKTEYKINDSFMYWKSGPFKGKIDIKTIKKIEYHKGIFVPTTWKPALSSVGLIITYNAFDDIYISPKEEELFVKQLLDINPNIIFKNKRI